MDFTNRTISWTRALTTVLSGVLLAGVGLTTVSCDSNGSSNSGDVQLTGSLDMKATPANGAVSLNWEEVEGAEVYRVYRSENADINFPSSPLDTSISDPSYTDESVENGTTYYYAVTAAKSQDVEGTESAPSKVVQSTPFTDPSRLTGTSGDANVELTWHKADGAATYNVYRSTSEDVDVSGSAVASGVSSASYTDAGLTNGTTYYYRITAVRAGQESSPSNEIAKTPTAKPPSRP